MYTYHCKIKFYDNILKLGHKDQMSRSHLDFLTHQLYCFIIIEIALNITIFFTIFLQNVE